MTTRFAVLLTSLLVLTACAKKEESPTDTACAAGDTDGDGLSDCVEQRGWDVVVEDMSKVRTTRHVTSDPAVADTDGDGLDDAEELSYFTDPRNPDTDGDSLDDWTEVKVYASSPTDMDSDDDARGPLQDKSPHPFLSDYNEVTMAHGTSPILADTDGDQLTDYDEVVGDWASAGYNPLIADLPKMVLELSSDQPVTVQLNAILTGSCTLTNSTYSGTLVKNETASTESSSRMNQNVMEMSADISAQVQGGFVGPVPNCSMSAEVGFGFSAGFVNETTTSFSQTNASSTAAEFRRFEQQECFQGQETTSGTITMGFKIRNAGNKAFTLNALNFTLLKRDPANPVLVKTLAAGVAPPLVANTSLSPGQSTGHLAVTATVSAGLAMELLRDPSGLFFEVGTYTLTDEFGRDYAYINSETRAKTAMLEIDFGNGTLRRHLVATNVARNPINPSVPAGVTVARALQIAGYTFDTATSDGFVTLATIHDGATAYTYDLAHNKFWLVYGNADALTTASGLQKVNFTDIVLQAGDYLSLALVQDQDMDGLFDPEEAFLGTDPLAVDTDLDMVDDFTEAHHARRNPAVAEFPGRYVAQVESGPQNGPVSTFAILTNGTLWAWGANGQGQLGLGGAAVGQFIAIPELVNRDTNWASVSTGGTSGSVGVTLAVKSNGTLWAMGSNYHGSLATTPTGGGLIQPTPLQVGTATNWRKVDVGLTHVIAIRKGASTEGDLWAWGSDEYGQVGSAASNLACPGNAASVTCQTSPVLIGDIVGGPPLYVAGWTDIAAGGYHSLAMTRIQTSSATGTAYAWGQNSYGQLGLGDIIQRNVPTDMGEAFASISAGTWVSAGVSRLPLNPVLYALGTWGRGDLGSLGRTAPDICGPVACAMSPNSANAPLHPTEPTFVDSQIDTTAFAIRNDALGLARLYAWGINDVGQMGVASTGTCATLDCATTPIEVTPSATVDWTSVVFGRAINANGELWTWGRNQYGQLGLGDFANRTIPVKVPEYPLP